MDKYETFYELTQNEHYNIDYSIVYRLANSDIAIIAIHGGKIEPFTTNIADLLANNKYDFYSFLGHKKNNNRNLHITSTNFNEPICMNILSKVNSTISIHGCNGEKPFYIIGGLEKKSISSIENELIMNGFNSKNSTNLSGYSTYNICNRNRRKMGVQLELSKELRVLMSKNEQLLNKFISIISKNIRGE
ncbi:MAG: poly-gamma-glutamate hydrolase family protein [Candidatus Marinimicrobia bacterium]|nr:poly-gamma-glutamate hydrolase family protein [Candidatus Neomarinimicrobiota bacterium]